MKHFFPALKILLSMIFLLGLAYPLLVTGIGQLVFPRQASGSRVEQSGVLLGSELIGQKFESLHYFWGRPSAIDYNPWPSGGSNLGQTSKVLQKLYLERKLKLMAAHPELQTEPPQDLLFASGSGLDPHISPAAARYQIQRVATARGMALEDLKKIVNSLTERRQLGILGEPRINVFNLNRALDHER